MTIYSKNFFSLKNRAIARLVMGFLAISVLVVLAGLVIFEKIKEKYEANEADSVKSFYANKIREWDDDWAAFSYRFKVSLEFLSLSENDRQSWNRLEDFLNVQGEETLFSHVIITTEKGEILFRFGRGVKAFSSLEELGETGRKWYYDAFSRRLFRTFSQTLWLGTERMVVLILFRPIDNALLYRNTYSNTDLRVEWKGRIAATALRARENALNPTEYKAITIDIPWTGEQIQYPPVLRLTHYMADILSAKELLVAGLIILGLQISTLSAVFGLWFVRLTRRINILSEKSLEFETGYGGDNVRPINAGEEILRPEDEISEVGRALETLTETVVQRDLERNVQDMRLRESETTARTLLDMPLAAVFLLDAQGVCLDANETLAKRFGVSVREMIGKSIWDFFPPEVRDGRRRMLAQAVATKAQVRYEDVRNEIVNDTVINPILNEQGEVAKVAIFAFDVTRRKRVEEELYAQQKYIKNIIDFMPSAIIGLDKDNRISHFNKVAELRSGLTESQVVGKDFFEVCHLLTPQTEAIREALANDKSALLEKSAYQSKSGVGYDDVLVYPFSTDEIKGAVVRIDDVTERVRIEEMVIQTEKMAIVGGLAAGMAHEINNPLGGIMQSAQVVLRRFSPDFPKNSQAAAECGVTLEAIGRYLEKREIVKYLQGIKELGDRIKNIVSNMLEFSRKSESRHAEASIAEILDKSIELAASDYDLRKRYDFRNIRIVRDYDPDVPKAFCVKTELEQVFLNILKNAAQSMSEGPNRDSPMIELLIRKDNGRVRIEIADNGPGMDEHVRGRVFEPFFTTKEPGHGTGLGLSVSYYIITNNHKGTVRVESAPGKGTRFIVYLPLAG